MNRVRWSLTALYFFISLTGCNRSEQAPAPPQNLRYVETTAAEERRNEEIALILESRRAAYPAALPDWVQKQRAHLTGRDIAKTYTFSRVAAWGDGEYKGQGFYWIGFVNSEGWLEMNLSTPLAGEDVARFYSIAQSYSAGAWKVEDPKVVILVPEGESRDIYAPGTGTNIAYPIVNKDPTAWKGEFCIKPEVTVCDLAGAFEKHLFSEANKAIADLTFTIRDRFQY